MGKKTQISEYHINYNLYNNYQVSATIDIFYGWNTRTTDENIFNCNKENLSEKEKQ